MKVEDHKNILDTIENNLDKPEVVRDNLKKLQDDYVTVDAAIQDKDKKIKDSDELISQLRDYNKALYKDHQQTTESKTNTEGTEEKEEEKEEPKKDFKDLFIKED